MPIGKFEITLNTLSENISLT